MTLPVSEVFGPTFQGEGPHTGRRTGFVRLGRCNLSCEWCDTPYTWDTTRYDVKAEAPNIPIAKVHEQLRPMNVDTVCLSGGEPLLHKGKLLELLTPEWRWHAETNGTIGPPVWWESRVEHTSVSPKINTRDPEKKRIKPLALLGWADLARHGRACFKFVCSTPRDLDTVAELTDRLSIDPRHVWVMPEGTTGPDLVARHRQLAQGIEDHGWNTTTRLHVFLYEAERRR